MKHRYVLAASIGLIMIAFGSSQIRQPHRWRIYVPDTLDAVLPVGKSTAMKIHGGTNALLGTLLLIGSKPTVTRRIAGMWWLWVALFCGRFDWRVALRDIAVGVALLSAAKKNDAL